MKSEGWEDAEELMAKSLVYGCNMGRSEAVMLAHDIALKLCEKYSLTLHPYLNEKIGDTHVSSINPTFGEALEKVAKQIEGIRDDIRRFM